MARLLVILATVLALAGVLILLVDPGEGPTTPEDERESADLPESGTDNPAPSEGPGPEAPRPVAADSGRGGGADCHGDRQNLDILDDVPQGVGDAAGEDAAIRCEGRRWRQDENEERQ